MIIRVLQSGFAIRDDCVSEGTIEGPLHDLRFPID